MNRLIRNVDGREGEDLEDVQASVAYMLERFGWSYVQETHNYLFMNLNLGCFAVRYEDLVADFNTTVSKWLDVWGVNSDVEVRSALLGAVAPHNPSIQTTANHHATGELYSKHFRDSIKAAFLMNASLVKLLSEQRSELGYQT